MPLKIRKTLFTIISFGLTLGAFHILNTDGPMWALLLCGVFSIAFFVLRNPWNEKEKEIIADEFQDIRGNPYVVSSVAEETFRIIQTKVRQLRGNEYDTAIGFMLVQINALYGSAFPPPLDETPKLSKESLNWAERIENKCKTLMISGLLGEDFFNQWLNEIEVSRQKIIKDSL